MRLHQYSFEDSHTDATDAFPSHPMPATARMTPEMLVMVIQYLTEPLPEPRDPIEDEIDAWLRADEAPE